MVVLSSQTIMASNPPGQCHGMGAATANTTARALAEALAISPVTGKARKHLILTLLEDPSCRLSAKHAELLLRWRMMSVEPGLSSVPALQPTAQPLQPHMLRAALSEDAVASTPVFLLSEQLMHMLSGAQPGPECSAAGDDLWDKASLHLDMQRLSSTLCMPPPAPSSSASPKPTLVSGAENPLPSFLYEYESPTASAASQKQAQGGQPESVASGPQAPPTAPASPGPEADNSSLARSSTRSLAERPYSDAPLSSPPLHPAASGPPRLHRTSAPCASQPDGSSGFSPGASSHHTMQGIPGVPEEVASCWGAGTEGLLGVGAPLSDPHAALRNTHNPRLNKQQSGPCALMGSEPHTSTGLAASWVSTSPQGSYYRQFSSGLPGSSPPDACGSHLLQARASGDGWGSLCAITGSEAAGMGSIISGRGGFMSASSFPTHHGLLLPGLTSQLSGLNGGSTTSPGNQVSQEGLSGRPPAPRRGDSNRLSPGSQGSEEHENDADSPGGMDLETALEAIINYESATGGDHGQGISAATAAAAQHALQQHVAAAMRSASAMPSNQAGGGSSSAGPSSSQQQGGSGNGQGSDGIGSSMSVNFAVTRMMSSDLAANSGPPTAFGVGSAPTSTAYMQRLPSASHAQGYGNTLARMDSNLALSGKDSSYSASNAASGVLPGGHNGLGMGAVSLSAPHPSAAWGNVVSREPHQIEINMSATDAAAAASLFATSAPSGNMHGPALVAAAARSMAAAVQQQQQRQQQVTLNVQPGLQRSMTATTAVALMAAAKQGNAGMPVTLAHQGAAAPGMGMSMRSQQLYSRMTPQMRADVQQLLLQFPGLKVEDLDESVLQQLITRRNEEDALAALRALTTADLTGLNPLAAYAVHGETGLPGFATTSLARTSSVPLASRALLQKLPPRVYARLEEVVSRCSYMDWKHFDAGVVKVMGQLSEISEADVLEELQLLEATDLSNVEYMPAYLNKRLNNRLWSRRKAQQAAQQAAGQH